MLRRASFEFEQLLIRKFADASGPGDFFARPRTRTRTQAQEQAEADARRARRDASFAARDGGGARVTRARERKCAPKCFRRDVRCSGRERRERRERCYARLATASVV